MKTKLNAAFKSSYSPYIILYFALLFFHLFMPNNFADDQYFCNVIKSSSLLEHTATFYQTWSARTLIEAATICIGALPKIVWQAINPALATFIAFALNKLLDITNLSAVCFTCALVFIFPWQTMQSAGWITTSMVYICPLAAFLGVCLICKKTQADKKASIWSYLLCAALSIYSLNMEQLTAFALLCLIFVFAFIIFSKQTPQPMLFVPLGAGIANLIYAFTCPGTAQRFANEVITRNKTFNMLNFFQKVEHGFSLTISDMVFNGYSIVIMCAALLALCIFVQHRSVFYRFICSGLLLITCALPLAVKYFKPLQAVQLAARIGVSNVLNLKAYLPFVFLCTVFLAFIICIYIAFGHNEKSLLALGIFIASVASRVALGLSPTLVASQERTAAILFFGLIALCAMLFSKLKVCAPKLVYPAALCCFLFVIRQGVIFAQLLF